MLLVFVALETLAIVVLSFIVFSQAMKIAELKSSLKSEQVRRGKEFEQLAPFSRKYPFNPEGFRFIGNPVDGIQFNEDSIVLVEFKSGSSTLSKKQRRIKELVRTGKVKFMEVRQ